MPLEPSQPDQRHVWVRGRGDHSPPWPGLVISWQHAPIHKITDSTWTALVLVTPFPGAMLGEWVSADRLEPIRDPAPVDGS